MPSLSSPWRATATGGVLLVRARPGQKRPRPPHLVDCGEGQGALELTVAAPPEDGKANKALLALLAQELGIKPSALHVQSGQTGKIKRIEIEGDPALLTTRIAPWLADE